MTAIEFDPQEKLDEMFDQINPRARATDPATAEVWLVAFAHNRFGAWQPARPLFGRRDFCCLEAVICTPGRHVKGVRVEIMLFLKGLLIGLAIAAPVGPIGVLCIRRTLNEGRLAGFVTGMGAATADGLYGAVAALGISAVSSRLVEHADPIRLIGGGFLCYLGAKTLLSQSTGNEATARGGGLLGIYGSSLALTITNPTTILSFVAVFAGLGLAEAADDRGAAGLIVLGVFFGSAAWWVFLSNFVGVFRRALTPARRIWINRLSGVVLVGFGGFALITALRHLF